jgi:hypothetical protein
MLVAGIAVRRATVAHEPLVTALYLAAVALDGRLIDHRDELDPQIAERIARWGKDCAATISITKR